MRKGNDLPESFLGQLMESCWKLEVETDVLML